MHLTEPRVKIPASARVADALSAIQARWRSLPIPLRQAATCWLILCGVYALIEYISVTFLDPVVDHSVTEHTAFSLHRFLLGFATGDAFNFYQPIAAHGYQRAVEAGFFPLYPLLIHLAALPFHGQHALAIAIGIGTLAAFLALWGVAQLATELSGLPGIGARVMRITVAYPLAFFLFTAQTEGLLLACVAWCFVCLHRRAWLGAAVLIFVAGLTRISALALFLPLVWEYAQAHRGVLIWLRSPSWRGVWWRELRYEAQHRWRVLRGIAEAIIVLCALPLALGIFLAILRASYQNPLAYLHAQTTFFGHRFTWPWQTVVLLAHTLISAPPGSFEQARYLLDLVPLAAFTLITVTTARRQPLAYTLFMAGLLALCIAAPVYPPVAQFPDPIVSAGRYLTAAMPCFLALGRWTTRYRWLEQWLMIAGMMLQAVLLVALAVGVWIV